jgi:hypothetical protein
MESKDEIISKLLKEVIYLKQVDSLTPKLYEIKAWDYIIRNGVKRSYFISLKHKCYSETSTNLLRW